MKKTIPLILIILFLLISLSACNNDYDKNRSGPIRIAALKGPTMMGLTKLAADNDAGNTENNYVFNIEAALDPITVGLSRKTIDAAAIACNSAAVLYNKSGLDISVAVINTLGVLYVIENKNVSAINTVADLKNKSVMMTGQGIVPQYTFEYLLNQYGITSNDINISFRAETSDVLAELIAGKTDIAILPQPFVTSALKQNANLRIALDITKEWQKLEAIENTPPITAVLVVRNSFLKYNKTAFNIFLDEYRQSVSYMTDINNLDAAAQLIVDYEILPSLPIAKAALPECNLTYIEGTDMKDKLSFFYNVLYDFNPQSIGGKLPIEKFFYQR